jgi:hypothetical protein
MHVCACMQGGEEEATDHDPFAALKDPSLKLKADDFPELPDFLRRERGQS